MTDNEAVLEALFRTVVRLQGSAMLHDGDSATLTVGNVELRYEFGPAPKFSWRIFTERVVQETESSS